MSGELVPSNGSTANTIAKGFGGSAAAYAAAAPVAVLAAHAPYADFHVIVAVGGNDTRFAPFARAIAAAAASAGAVTQTIVSPNTAHDWRTVHYAFANALPSIAVRTGLAQ